MKLTAVTGAALALFALAGAQGKDTDKKPDVYGLGVWGAESTYNKSYNPSSEITFSGKIIGIVNSETPDPTTSPGTTILVKSSNGGSSAVDLGPSWYINNISPKIAINDRVTVTGSKVFIDGKSYILGRKLVKGSRVLYLRETTGFPMWVATRGHVDVASLNPTPTPTTTAQNQPVSMSGQVQRVINVTDPQTGVPTSVLVVNTARGPVDVQLGPDWFIQHQNVQFMPTGNITFVGTSVTPLPGSPTPIYVANNVAWGDQVLILRNNLGFPVWSPWSPIR